MLKTENPTNAAKALAAFRKKYHVRKGYTAHFEHGQLWIVGIDGDSYSVVDAEGPGSVNGFDFEQVNGKEED